MELIKGQQFRRPDIQLEADKNYSRSTKQSGPYRSSGDVIHLNTKLLDTHDVAHHLVSQWPIYRNGVFPDNNTRYRFSNVSPKPTTFQLVEIASRARYAFVIQGHYFSSRKLFQDIYHLFSNAVTFLVKYAIPDDAVVHIVVVSDQVYIEEFGDEASGLTIEKRIKLLKILEKFGRPESKPIKFLEGIKQANELFERKGGTIVLLGMLEDLPDMSLLTATELQGSRFSALMTFITDDMSHGSFSALEKLSSETAGTILCLKMDHTELLTLFWRIVDGLVSLYSSPKGRHASLATIFREVVDVSVEEKNGTFWVPSSEAEKMAVLVKCNREIDIGTVNSEEMEKGDFYSYYFTGDTSHNETYEYYVKGRWYTSCVFLVVAQQKVTREFPVHWNISEIEVKTKTVKALYVDLHGRNSLNVDVWVNVYPSSTTDSFKLLDSGGDPDNKAADGIYSGYWLPILNEGISSLSLNITWREQDSERVFFHYSFLGSYLVTEAGKLALSDFAPSPIQNMKLIGLPGNYINMTWTAPGGHLDKGRAKSYRVRYSSDREFSNSRNLVQSDETTTPQDAGSTEIVAFHNPSSSVYQTPQLIYVVTQSVNGEDDISEISNILEVSLELKASTTGGAGEDDTTPAGCLPVVSENREASKKELIIIYSISFAGFILLVIIVNLSICWCWSANRRNGNGEHHIRYVPPMKNERTKNITIPRSNEVEQNVESRSSTQRARTSLGNKRPAFRNPSEDATESENDSVERRRPFPRNLNDDSPGVQNNHQEYIEAYSSTAPMNLDHLKAKNLPRSSQNPNGYVLDQHQNSFRPEVYTQEIPSPKSTFYREHEKYAVPPRVSRPPVRREDPISLNNGHPQDGDSYDCSDEEGPYLSNPLGLNMCDLEGRNSAAISSTGSDTVPRYKVDGVYYSLPENSENKREVPTTYV